VEEKAYVSWVQPRVLSLSQIGGLGVRLEEWVGKLSGVEARIAAEVEEK
jgi:26S proteasome regulatory subunit N9